MTSSLSESPDELRWREAAIGGPKKRAASDLIARTADDLAIEPLYLPRHLAGLERRGEPGAPPYVRGAGGAWVVAQRYELFAARPAGDGPAARPSTDGDDLDRVALAIRADRAAGVEAAWLAPARALTSREKLALATALSGCGGDVLLEAGEDTADLAAALRSAGLGVDACFDPVGTSALRGALEMGWDGATRVAHKLVDAADAGRHPLAASAAVVHEAGGTPAQEIAFALGSAVELVRALEGAGVPPRSTLSNIAVIVAPGPDVTLGIVKLRALRLAWQKLAAALGVEARPFLAGIGSRRALSVLDAPTNMIRATLETTALVLGGADVIATRAFDSLALAPAARSKTGARLAKNTQLVLRDESHLGAVADPGGGSYFIEAATDALARAAWSAFRELEREGGVRASLASGAFAARVAGARAAADKLVATKKRLLVGVNDFAVTEDGVQAVEAAPPAGPLAPSRAAAAFERVRARATELTRLGRRPRALLVCLGEGADYRAREEFSRRFFEVGGFYVDSESGGGTDWIRASVSKAGGPLVVLCSSDERYAELAAAAIAAAKAGGAPRVILAGRPGALEATLRAAGLDMSIHFGCDAIPILEAALEGGAS
jgi:methylmalonyl-CoA mutase